MIDDADFDAWMDEVNMCIHNAIGVRAGDLPDQTYRAWFEDGMEPDEAATEVLAGGL